VTIMPAAFIREANSDPCWKPRRVLLFSGHMIDATGRIPPRFPAEMEAIAAGKIAETLDELAADSEDLGLTQGACGGDILFAEACQQRGVKLQLLQPFEEAEFIEKSVATVGGDWLSRYQMIKLRLDTPPLAASQQLGPMPESMNAYERCNLWLLTSALAYGADKVSLICLWDGGGGDGLGGTGHMVDEVRKQQGRVVWLDTRKLW
jgi:hypothetical protein